MEHSLIIKLFNTIIMIMYGLIFFGLFTYYMRKYDNINTIRYKVAKNEMIISVITIALLTIGNILLS